MSEGSSIFWAAFGGGAAAGIFTLFAVILAEWLRWRSDRPLLKASLRFAKHFGPGRPSDNLMLSFEARNPHSKTIVVQSFALRLGHAKDNVSNLQIRPNFTPSELKGGGSITQYVDSTLFLTMLREQGMRPSEIKWVLVNTAIGEYRNRIKLGVLRSLKKEFGAS